MRKLTEYTRKRNIKEQDKDTMRWAITPFPMGVALSNDYPEVEQAVRFLRQVAAGRSCIKMASSVYTRIRFFLLTVTYSRFSRISLLKATPGLH
jgi:putative ABC transport system permease protein